MDTAQWTTSRLLSTAARLTELHQNQQLMDLGVTHASANTLKVLSESGPVSQTHLADLVHVQAQTMGKLLEKLELKGFVLRTRDTSDTRSIRVLITARGQSLVQHIDQIGRTAAESAGLTDQVLRNHLIAIITQHRPTPT